VLWLTEDEDVQKCGTPSDSKGVGSLPHTYVVRNLWFFNRRISLELRATCKHRQKPRAFGEGRDH
jgi:hypothetical protein